MSPEMTLAPHFGTLARQIMEQAVLAAARDDLGMQTRAATLGESAPNGKADLFVEVVTPYSAAERVRFTVRQGSEDGKIVAAVDRPLSAENPAKYAAFVEMCESYARGPFASALKQAGVEARPVAIHASTAVPAQVRPSSSLRQISVAVRA